MPAASGINQAAQCSSAVTTHAPALLLCVFTGRWNEEEEDKLKQLVEWYLRERGAPPVDDGRIVLDDINWEIIAEKMGTRNSLQCMDKW